LAQKAAVFSIMETPKLNVSFKDASMKSIHTVYVQNQDGSPLMPTRPAKAKWLKKHGKAKVVRRSPFTIQLTYQIENPQKQPTSLAFDDGETVGVAVITKNKTHQRVVFLAQMRCRGKEITDNLSRRRKLRKARRRRTRNRRQKKRFTKLSLPPSVLADISAKMRLIHQILSIIPISEIRWEPLALSIEKQKKDSKNAPRLLPPYLQEKKHRLAYQLNEKKRKKVIKRDGERCCICYRQVTQDTAYIYTTSSKNRHGDLMTLCKRCSRKIQDERFVISLDPSKFSDIRGAARVMHGKNELGRRLKAIGLPIFLVNGWRTGQCRKKLGLQKSHTNDAVAIGSKGEECLLMESFYLVKLRARHQRKLFYQNPGDREIQRIRKEMVDENDHDGNRKSRSIRRRVRRKLYQQRYGKGGVENKRKLIGYSSEPFSPYDAICVTKNGERNLYENRKILNTQGIPSPKEIAKIFKRGDIVKTAEGLLAEVVTLFSNGKVGIRFLEHQKERKQQRTARIPEKLSLVAGKKTMQFVQLPISKE